MARPSNRQILLAILREVYRMTQEMDRLKASVHRNTDVTASAAVMIHGFAEQMRTASSDPAAVAALADELDSSADALAAAVAANASPAAAQPEPNPNA